MKEEYSKDGVGFRVFERRLMMRRKLILFFAGGGGGSVPRKDVTKISGR